MPYIALEDFRHGMDRRRARVNGPPGSAWTLKNCHLTRGGEIARNKKFVHMFDLPGNTTGLAADSDFLNTFTHLGSLTNPVPGDVRLRQLVHPLNSARNLERVLDVTKFNGEIYSVAEFSDGAVYHYFGGSRVTDMDTVSAAVVTNTIVAADFAEQLDRALDDFTVRSAGTTIVVTGQINDSFTASANVDINGTDNGQTINLTTEQSATVSLPEIDYFQLSGSFNAADILEITIDGTLYEYRYSAGGTGRTALTYGGKIYTVVDTLLYFSAVGDATDWSGAGSGFIEMNNNAGDIGRLTAAAPYQNLLASFGPNAVVLFDVDADPANSSLAGTVLNTGTEAGRSVVPYGNFDVFYLGESGVRSLRPRDSSGTANVEDVGTAVDAELQEFLATLTKEERLSARGVYEPQEGRYWLAVGDRIYEYSHFPGGKITAWSYFEPGFTVEDFAVLRGRVYARAGDSVYLYGGADGETYPDADEQEVLVELPYLTGGSPATLKRIEGLDLSVTNEWTVKILPDPEDSAVEITVGTVDYVTYARGRVPVDHPTTHVALKLECSAAGAATIGSLVVHYEDPHESG